MNNAQNESAAAADCRKEDIMKQSNKITALYERLSKDDGDKPESCSIETQKRILEEYAEQNGLTPYRHWTDDGHSGKDFQRPAFQDLINEIEKGNIGTVVVKELDRFGRAYLESGLYREMFRKAGVRFISLAEGHDSLNGDDDDFTPFREVINEFYLRQYSRKIKQAWRSRGMAGKHTASSAPYGYLKSETDKNQWIIDPIAANVVRRIFQMTMEGMGPYQICCALKAEKVEMPGYYLAQKSAGLHQSHVFPDPYNWTSSSVCAILKKKEYLGHTVNFKSKKNSYKDKKNTYVPEDEWVIFENTHEPIIDQALFDNVQRIRGGIKRRPDGWGYVHPLSGLMFCADCGGKLYVHRIVNGKDRPQYVCGNYAKSSAVIKSGIVCESGHRIDAATAMELVRDTLKRIADYAKTDKAAFTKSVQELLAAQQTDEIKKQKKRLAVCKKRAADLNTLFKKIYEDNALGKLSDSRFESLSNDYGQEQDALDKEIAELQSSVERYEDGSGKAKQFIDLVNRYTDFTELTVPMINEFVNKIVVHERDRRGSIDSTQSVEIHLNFIGEYKLPEQEADPVLTAEQEEERRKKEATKDRLYQNYLKRKANGKQKEWEQSYNEKRKARYAENKAALFAEGATLGANALTPAINI